MFKSKKNIKKISFPLLALTFAFTPAVSGVSAAETGQTATTDSTSATSSSLPWMNKSLSPETRANLLINAMTLAQKVQQLAGAGNSLIPELPQSGPAYRHILGIPELGIPTFRITNGPVGVGWGDYTPQDLTTALPDTMGLAASFDKDLAYTYGDLAGNEARELGYHELEAPGVNLARVGEGGRNFEYLGEDPYLAGALATSEVKAIQSHDVIAMTKHYVGNDQEYNRMGINDNIADNVLHELYLLPFEMTVKDGQVGSIMASYNRVNGTYASENAYLLNTVLRDQWGFKGYVQSDFGATHSTGALNAGLDVEMHNRTWFTLDKISAAIGNGSLTTATVDQALYHRYVQMFKFGIFDRPIVHGSIDVTGDGATARNIGEQTAVLLKNDQNVLPIKSDVRNIAVIGQSTFVDKAVVGGGGSSTAVPTYTVNPVDGLQNALNKIGSNATVTKVTVADDNSNLDQAVAAATNADVVVVMAGVITSEGKDRPDLSLPNNQDAIVSAVAAANKKTVVVLKDGDPVLMPWVNQVPSVLEAWFPGQEDGNIVGDLLVGLANPSGKTPVTYPVAKADTPTSITDRYPGVNQGILDASGKEIPQVYYSEGLDMGYRWYDSQNIKPLFAFGHGLSYTNFEISKLVVTPKTTDGTKPLQVSFFVENTGKVAGAEVPQVYLGLPASANEPPKRLVGFEKVQLNPGEKKHVTVTIDPAASNHPLSVWDTSSQSWKTLDGAYNVYVGNASDNITLTDSITVRTPAGHSR